MQKEAFLAGEGDAWFQRNHAALGLQTAVRLRPLQLFLPYLAPGDEALEIGCADGSNLAALARQCGVRGCGVDPSRQAIEAGKRKYPMLDLRQGTAEALPFDEGRFKLVWFGFCLYLLDRSELMRAIAEADRVCAEGGFIAITDFDPVLPCRRPYHHRPGLFSWKMDYSRLFLANPAYVLVAKASYGHGAETFHPDPGERIATWLLHKSLAHAYFPEEEQR
ncbi:class I SAM-dependent methyltransferase [Sulfuricystis multivorans]|uniref:class I SAM-dependent methyltransferase n=1 Tax=Sulfuricystis multivorans TaxID=2211108 RepID=UPI00155837FE|nr:class I SAM-dependent methyltransferase [Sulfuricystis multivorans]